MNKPNLEHHQASWHRDLPYQDWVISKPLGFNSFFCLTDFTIENGATAILPYSHKLDHFPSSQFVESNQIQITAKAGSVLFFDSMIYHRASYNSSESTRVGINNMFVVPILKQQINIPASVNYELNEMEKQILGFNYQLADSVNEYRNQRIQKSIK
jgi:ectoine hydroxylase-related dioxygenase (phytanoyl-CoA dioxygenase family)